MGVETWTDEKQEAFDKAIKKWIEINGRLPSLEEESTVWESLAFPTQPQEKEEDKH